jgi:hypothetical protein
MATLITAQYNLGGQVLRDQLGAPDATRRLRVF